jgi:hypothetical protein
MVPGPSGRQPDINDVGRRDLHVGVLRAKPQRLNSPRTRENGQIVAQNGPVDFFKRIVDEQPIIGA